MKIYTLTVNKKGEFPYGGTYPLAIAFRNKNRAKEWIVNNHIAVLYPDYFYKFIDGDRCWISIDPYRNDQRDIEAYNDGEAFYIDIIETNLV